MDWKKELKIALIIFAVFMGCFFLPVESHRFTQSIIESLKLVKWYAQEHVLLCLLPAFFIAGAIGVFVKQGSVMKYLGPNANKAVAYLVASVSGTILAVCSCTILPLFAGIYRMGAGLGPACAFLYSGPAINVLAIILTMRLLGPQLGIARAVGAILFSVIIGLAMHFIFRKEQMQKINAHNAMATDEKGRPVAHTIIYFALMILILVFANWAKPKEQDANIWQAIHGAKWIVTSIVAVILGIVLVAWYNIKAWKMTLAGIAVGSAYVISYHIIPALISETALVSFSKFQPMIPFGIGIGAIATVTATTKGESATWFQSSWTFAKQIMPLLFFGVLVAGVFLGAPTADGSTSDNGLIPAAWIAKLVGGNSFGANFFAAIAGAFMYFATLTEVPILQGLINNGMGQGPALALLLAGPALSLPNMLVIRSVMGTKKTVVYVTLVVIMATISGSIYGSFF
ncbi:MAG: permease [Phycisphaerae bacterium]|nr:permease [Phycisphaerae bacterium]